MGVWFELRFLHFGMHRLSPFGDSGVRWRESAILKPILPAATTQQLPCEPGCPQPNLAWNDLGMTKVVPNVARYSAQMSRPYAVGSAGRRLRPSPACQGVLLTSEPGLTSF